MHKHADGISNHSASKRATHLAISTFGPLSNNLPRPNAMEQADPTARLYATPASRYRGYEMEGEVRGEG